MAWVAGVDERVCHGNHLVIPEQFPKDARGLRMEILR